jgi:ubiquinone/menaquinone biosynthesis C-methylase UbiE
VTSELSSLLNQDAVRRFFDSTSSTYDERRFGFLQCRREALIKERIVGGQTLDIGCNCGALMRRYGQGLRCIGIDLSFACLARANNLRASQRHSFVQTAASHLPFKDAAFDTVVCSETLYYLDSPTSCLLEAQRTLRPGGTIIVISSNPLFYRLGRTIGVWMRLTPRDINPRPHSAHELVSLLTESGFSTIEVLHYDPIPMRGFGFLNRVPLLRKLGFLIIVVGRKDSEEVRPC